MQNHSKNTDASFSPIPTDLFDLQVAQVPRSPKLSIFVRTMTTTDIEPITLPLVHTYGIIRQQDIRLQAALIDSAFLK